VPDSSSLQTALGKVRSHGLRYSAVSVVNVVFGQALLFVFVRLFSATTEWSKGVAWTMANIVAVSLSAVPAYYLNRRWVWGKRGKSHFTKEILPFWGFAFAGLVLSSLAVNLAAGITDWKIVANIANILAFGVLWVVKFFVLDSAVFGKRHHGNEGLTDEGFAGTGDDASGASVTGASAR
jgi:putative flippase GtrA